MAENLKKFFKKKKADFKFKKAGPGQRLCDEIPKPAPVRQSSPQVPERAEMSEEAKQAAAAALARLQSKTCSTSSGFGASTSFKLMKDDVKRELSSDRKISDFGRQSGSQSAPTKEYEASQYAADGVYFRCPLLGPEILSKAEWHAKIKEYLYAQLETEKGLTAALIIRNCNSNVEKINACIETLCKYLQNIVNHPDEEKYQKIRLSNKAFQERVKGIEGAIELLEDAGFVKEELPIQDHVEEFLVFSTERVKDIEYLQVLIDALENAQRIELELDRNIQVLQPTQAEKRTHLPDEFYRYTPDELKKEHQSRQESLENSLALRTKAMRERQEQREMRKYRYALIRIRFPDGVFLQGTFSVHDKYEEVVKFVQENLITSGQFSLLLPDNGKTLKPEDFDKTLMELRLVPATVLIFRPESVTDDTPISYLKPDVLVLLQNL